MLESIIYISLFIISIIIIVVLYKCIKPYFIKYDTTLLLTGGLGSGKTLTAVKNSVILLRKQRIKVFFHNKIKRHVINTFRRIKSKVNKNYRFESIKKVEKPLLYSNIPVNFKPTPFSKKREWSKKLEKEHLTLFKKINEYSVVLIDELPQLLNQFNWNLEIVQNNINEFITFFRHYIGGYLIITAQATDDVVAQIRRKLNQAIWCFDFHGYKLFGIGLFYTIRMCDIMLNDDFSTFTTTYIEDNTKKHWGLFPPNNTYETRCYKKRYWNAYLQPHNENQIEFNNIFTNEIIKLKAYDSPLDDYKNLTLQQRMLYLEKLYNKSKELKK